MNQPSSRRSFTALRQLPISALSFMALFAALGTGACVEPIEDPSISCPGEMDACAGICTETISHVTHCGSCGNSCPGAQVCSLGECKDACDPGLQLCGEDCANLLGNAEHCGGCFQACGDGEVCDNQVCVCPEGSSCSAAQAQASGGAAADGMIGTGGDGVGGELSSGGALSTGSTGSSGGVGGSLSTGGVAGSGVGSAGTGAASSTGGVMNSGGTPSAGGMPAAGGMLSTGGTVAAGGSTGEPCTDVAPDPPADWPEATCPLWASETTECPNTWMVDNHYCDESCGRCTP